MAARRPIEDFLVHPASPRTPPHDFRMPDSSRSSMAYESLLDEYAPSILEEATEVDLSRWPVGLKATIKDIATEPVYWQRYGSEEELASPTDKDDHSLRTASSVSFESEDDFDEGSLHDLDGASISEACPCGLAQAVKVVAIGKAKIVSTPPKAAQKGADDHEVTASQATPTHQPASRLATALEQQTVSEPSRSPYVGSAQACYDSSTESSDAAEAAASAIRRRKAIRQRPSLPTLKSTPEHSKSIPLVPARQLPRSGTVTDFLQRDPYPRAVPATPLPSPSASSKPFSKRRLHRLSNSIGLVSFNKSVRPATETIVEQEPFRFEPTPGIRGTPSSARSNTTPRSTPRPKMVARGASERAPLLVLPPCPKNYESDIDILARTMNSDSSDNGRKLQKRIVSPTMVSTQA